MQPSVSVYRRPLVCCMVPAIVAGVLLSTSLSAQASSSTELELNQVDPQNELTIAIEPQPELNLEFVPTESIVATINEAPNTATGESTSETISAALPSIAEPTETEPTGANVAATQAVQAVPVEAPVLEPIATAYRTKTAFNIALNPDSNSTSSLTAYSVNSSDILVTQDPAPLTEQPINPGTETKTGSSYVGFGVNFGLSGSRNALTNTSFAIISKIGLNQHLSVRPTFLIRNDVYIAVPVTFDFEPIDIEGYKLGTYVGGGVGISTGNSSYIRPLLTAGLDIPLGRQFTGNVGLNFAFFDTVDVGLIVGVGYNFRGF